jgi:glycosyltransferase involved in cell wall biosynthesis
VPAVTALMPTYNAAAFVERTLRSLLAQDHGDLLVLISDDASSDATVDICREVAAGDSRVSVTVQPRNLGWIANYRWLQARASTPLVFHAPHDDVFAPGYVRRCVQALDEVPASVLAYSATNWHKLDGSLVVFDQHVAASPAVMQRVRPYLRNRGVDRWGPFRGVIRSDVLRRVGGLRRGLSPEADGRMLFRLAVEGPFAFVPEVLVDKYQHDGSTASTFRSAVDRSILGLAPEVIATGLPVAQRTEMLRMLVSEVRRRHRGGTRTSRVRAP